MLPSEQRLELILLENEKNRIYRTACRLDHLGGLRERGDQRGFLAIPIDQISEIESELFRGLELFDL